MLRYEELKKGDILVPDGGFDCITKNSRKRVEKDDDGFYVTCNEGHHYLEGHFEDDGFVIGFEKLEHA